MVGVWVTMLQCKESYGTVGAGATRSDLYVPVGGKLLADGSSPQSYHRIKVAVL